VARGRYILAAETWNEFSEGIHVQETTQTGRLYIDLMCEYVEQFSAPDCAAASAGARGNARR
jgi:hypothetical protein